MKRRYKPSPALRQALDQLVAWLLEQREHAGLSYPAMAAAAGRAGMPISEGTLARAVDGRLPTERTVKAFAAACGADRVRAQQLWAAAQAAAYPRPRRRLPTSLYTREHLAAELRRIRAEAGEPTLRTIEEAAGLGENGRSLLPHTTVAQVLKGKRLPEKALLAAFLLACGISGPDADPYLAARDRIAAGVQPPTPGSDYWYPCARAERAEDRAARAEEKRRYSGQVEEDLDEYDQSLRDQEDVIPYTDAEIAAWEAEAKAADALEPDRESLADSIKRLGAVGGRAADGPHRGPGG